MWCFLNAVCDSEVITEDLLLLLRQANPALQTFHTPDPETLLDNSRDQDVSRVLFSIVTDGSFQTRCHYAELTW